MLELSRVFLLEINYKRTSKGLGIKLQLFHLLLDSPALSSCVLFTTFLHSLWLLFTRVVFYLNVNRWAVI